jgi:hypothetical protein
VGHFFWVKFPPPPPPPPQKKRKKKEKKCKIFSSYSLNSLQKNHFPFMATGSSEVVILLLFDFAWLPTASMQFLRTNFENFHISSPCIPLPMHSYHF